VIATVPAVVMMIPSSSIPRSGANKAVISMPTALSDAVTDREPFRAIADTQTL
jgi:hypothetical protein